MDSEHAPPSPFRTGEVVGGRYRIVRPIGAGGMGQVFLAEDMRLSGQRWALKFVPASGEDPAQAEKEAAIMTALSHPSLPRIVDAFPLHEAGHCIVMDYLEGETLLARSAACNHALPWRKVVHYGTQLCDLLDYLHSRDSPIVFRDIKPSNVIVGGGDAVRLVDFGIARTYKAGQEQDTVHVGSVGFAAPELIANRQTDHRADLYSLGGLLYFLLGGGQMYNFTKQPLHEIAVNVPESLCNAVMRLLEQDPEARFPDAKAAKAALETVLRQDAPARAAAKDAGAVRGMRMIVAVFGLFPHAGTTFVSALLAKLLAERKLQTNYTAFPWAKEDPYMRMLHTAKAADGEWREHGVVWRLPSSAGIHGGSAVDDFDAAALFKLLFETRGDVAVFDVPSTAHPAAAEAMLRAADLAIAVASPDPGGLRSKDAVDNWRRINGAAGGGRVEWIASRLPPQRKLKEFYALFSVRPIASIPELPYEKMIDCRWNGTLPFTEEPYATILENALQPLLERIAPGRNRKGLKQAAKRWLAKHWQNGYNKDVN